MAGHWTDAHLITSALLRTAREDLPQPLADRLRDLAAWRDEITALSAAQAAMSDVLRQETRRHVDHTTRAGVESLVFHVDAVGREIEKFTSGYVHDAQRLIDALEAGAADPNQVAHRDLGPDLTGVALPAEMADLPRTHRMRAALESIAAARRARARIDQGERAHEDYEHTEEYQELHEHIEAAEDAPLIFADGLVHALPVLLQTYLPVREDARP